MRPTISSTRTKARNTSVLPLKSTKVQIICPAYQQTIGNSCTDRPTTSTGRESLRSADMPVAWEKGVRWAGFWSHLTRMDLRRRFVSKSLREICESACKWKSIVWGWLMLLGRGTTHIGCGSIRSGPAGIRKRLESQNNLHSATNKKTSIKNFLSLTVKM